jgi:predicted RNA-binding Zn-ribbon protein involved in translation (DUF1610 family)
MDGKGFEIWTGKCRVGIDEQRDTGYRMQDISCIMHHGSLYRGGYMSKNKKMKCADCGVDMNLHAEKISYTAAMAEMDKIDPELGGVMEEFHTCPECGKTESQKANG